MEHLTITPQNLPYCVLPREGSALIVAGGGAWGAYATGWLRARNHEYRAAAGISTGNLIAPIALAGDYDQLVEAYSNVDLASIFSVRPFTKKGKLRVLHALKRLVLRKGSFGEMRPLQKLIRQFYPLSTHNKNYLSGKVALCGALNLSCEPYEMDLFRTDTSLYEEFIAAMYASCCFWPVGEVAKINNMQYVDGGYVETLLIEEILALGYRTIDVLTLRPKCVERTSNVPTKRFFEVGKRILTAIRYDTVYENLNRAIAVARQREEVTIHVHYTPHKLSENAMYFNKAQMQDWVKMGEDNAHSMQYSETY